MEKTKAGVLRFLGRKNQPVPGDISGLVDECILHMRVAATPRHIKMTLELSLGAGGISLAGTALLLRGGDIARHLSGCKSCVLMAATLGTDADGLIRRWERTDLTRSLVLDACASQLIEEYCDEIEAQTRDAAAAEGLAATGRFSPGYGDLALDIQPRILDALDAGRRIGLTCTESLILLPRKSVTAIIGLGGSAVQGTSGCDICALRDRCTFRKDGNSNGCNQHNKG